MYKNQLQELAQRSCFNLPSYSCIREGPDHAPRFKSTVNFNGDTFESPNFCTTLRLAEHSAAEVALIALACRGPSHSLAARILDETGVYKNLLQEVSQRVGACLPMYTTFRSGLGHLPVFTCTVELAGITFTGEPAKNKKQAEKNAAMSAWSSLKLLAQKSETSSSSSDKVSNDEPEHVTVARALHNYLTKAKLSNTSFPIKFPMPNSRPLNPQPPPFSASKILPLICSKTTTPWSRPVNNSFVLSTASEGHTLLSVESPNVRPQKLPGAGAGAAPYIPVRNNFRAYRGIAPPVTIRNAIPVFSAPPPQMMRSPYMGVAPPVCIRQAVPVFAAPPPPPVIRVQEPPPSSSTSTPPVRVQEPPPASTPCIAPPEQKSNKEDNGGVSGKLTENREEKSVPEENEAVEDLKELKI